MVEGEELIEPPRVCAHDVDAVHAKFAEVVGELFRARRTHLARGDMRRAACEGSNLGGLAARRGAHIEDIGPIACGKGERRKHRGKALQVDLTFLIELKLPYCLLPYAVAQHERVFIPLSVSFSATSPGVVLRALARRVTGRAAAAANPAWTRLASWSLIAAYAWAMSSGVRGNGAVVDPAFMRPLRERVARCCPRLVSVSAW